MIVILGREDAADHSEAFEQMFRGRAIVFHQRLRWDVVVHDGLERDRCDDETDVIYMVAMDRDGKVAGSLRLLPMTGETMLRNEFAGFFAEPIPDIGNAWECTRFCVHPPSSEQSSTARGVSSELLIGLCEYALSRGVDHILGLYEAHMERIYQRIGWAPQPLVQSAERKLVLGLWTVSDIALASMRKQLPSPHFQTAA